MIDNSSFTIRIPIYLDNLQKLLFDPINVKIKEVRIEKESLEYNACQIDINQKIIIFRKAKITPKKIGQFVTLWKRNKKSTIKPFTINDSIELYVIEVLDKTKIGYFLFNKRILNEKGILSGKHEGKRGFRVYPSWDKPMNKQGLTTQNWQLPFFIETSIEKINIESITKHLNLLLN
ncbi:MepB protein [Leptospira bouyouniensis]|uniref:MepB protein n=1 Tax=Leptospira bouyouniensis TaxID=2484911 RepID=A0A7I0HRU9_9LEPT|nr:MepB family protein [Leptospira bouyouniensis]TGL04919.1 MepB protein [Leptospira bouyouniensis]